MTKPRKSGLGKGLDSLIPEIIDNNGRKAPEDGKAVTLMRISNIEPNRMQPRKEFAQEALEDFNDLIAKDKPKPKPRAKPKPKAKPEVIEEVEEQDVEEVLADDDTVFEVTDDFLPKEN